jgi:hypothetical protein
MDSVTLNSAYSSGNCSGFTPAFPFNPFPLAKGKEPNTGASIINPGNLSI